MQPLETVALVLWGTGLISTVLGAAFFLFTKSDEKKGAVAWQKEKEAAVRERLLFHKDVPDPLPIDPRAYDFGYSLCKMFGGIGILLPIASVVLVFLPSLG